MLICDKCGNEVERYIQTRDLPTPLVFTFGLIDLCKYCRNSFYSKEEELNEKYLEEREKIEEQRKKEIREWIKAK